MRRSQPALLISIGHPQRHRASQSPSTISRTESGSKAQSAAAAPMLIGSQHHRRTLPRRSLSMISLTDSDPDMEAAQAAPSISIGSAERHHRPPLRISTRSRASRSPSVISLTDSNLEDMQGSDQMPSLPPQPAFVTPGSHACVHAHGDSQVDPIIVEDVHLWPTDFHVCDIAQFIRLTRLPRRQQKLRTFFEEYFGVPYSPQMFRRTRHLWEYQENKGLHAQFIDYGRSEKGRWAMFVTEAKHTF
jgi:hypothetical protein